MLPTTPNGVPAAATRTEPQLTDRTRKPQGVIQKNLKVLFYMGAVAVLVLAILVSSYKKKPGLVPKPQDPVSAPVVQDNTANNVAAFHAQLDAEHQRRQQDDVPNSPAMQGTPAQQTASAAFGPNGLPVAATACVPGQPPALTRSSSTPDSHMFLFPVPLRRLTYIRMMRLHLVNA